jgi:hypothetical protein
MIQKEAGDHQLFLCLEKIDEFVDVPCLSPIIEFGCKLLAL